MHVLTVLINDSHFSKPTLLLQLVASDFCDLVQKYNTWLDTEWSARIEAAVWHFCYDAGAPPETLGEMLESHAESLHDDFVAYYNWLE